jgi:hypothetical protein
VFQKIRPQAIHIEIQYCIVPDYLRKKKNINNDKYLQVVLGLSEKCGMTPLNDKMGKNI